MRGNIEHRTSNAEHRRAEKWITIGTVQWPWFVFEMGAGTPEGFHVAWRGRLGVFQPVQFRKAEHLCWAIERRLHLAGLIWVAMATERTRGLHGARELRVLVRRPAKLLAADFADERRF